VISHNNRVNFSRYKCRLGLSRVERDFWFLTACFHPTPPSYSYRNRAAMGKKNKSKNTKMKYLKGLSKNLELFYPEFNNSFMCPICLKIISLSNKNRISEAHIIPKAAGGNVKTYLCTSCNNNFGSQQDKWFGEHVRLNEKKKHMLQTNIKKGYFLFNDIKINGEWKYAQNNKLELLIYGNRNSPEMNDHILSKFQKEIPKSLSMPIPILGKDRLIKVGYLTAAYLLCFATFGYSWILQSYLDEIRNQIQTPEEKIISEIFWSKSKRFQVRMSAIKR